MTVTRDTNRLARLCKPAPHSEFLVPERSLRNLKWLNFFVADMGTSFGPFVSVALVQAGWTQASIGYALGAGSLAALVGQMPAGALIDSMHNKRRLAGLALLGIAAAALIIALMPSHAPVFAALVTQNLAGVVLGPTIAALTLSLSQKGALGERLGSNMRFQALGAAGAAILLGVLGQHFGTRAVFLAAAALAIPALLALRGVHPMDLATAASRTDHPAALSPLLRGRMPAPKHLFTDRRLLAFGLCVVLFFLGNAGIVTLAANDFASSDPHIANLLVPAAIVLPQGIAALLSPRLGRFAQAWGRRPVLLIGFCAVPLRALLFAIGGPPELMVAYQALDGLGAATFGVMLPLVVADITRDSGRFNLAYATLGLAVTGGAALSNALAGAIATHIGSSVAFAALAGAGLLAMAAVAFVLPETRPTT